VEAPAGAPTGLNGSHAPGRPFGEVVGEASRARYGGQEVRGVVQGLHLLEGAGDDVASGSDRRGRRRDVVDAPGQPGVQGERVGRQHPGIPKSEQGSFPFDLEGDPADSLGKPRIAVFVVPEHPPLTGHRDVRAAAGPRVSEITPQVQEPQCLDVHSCPLGQRGDLLHMERKARYGGLDHLVEPGPSGGGGDVPAKSFELREPLNDGADRCGGMLAQGGEAGLPGPGNRQPRHGPEPALAKRRGHVPAG
jgi:hypothetical protein